MSVLIAFTLDVPLIEFRLSQGKSLKKKEMNMCLEEIRVGVLGKLNYLEVKLRFASVRTR